MVADLLFSILVARGGMWLIREFFLNLIDCVIRAVMGDPDYGIVQPDHYLGYQPVSRDSKRVGSFAGVASARVGRSPGSLEMYDELL